ncbi:MAG: hypothetical protein AAGF02_00230, partial [Actinomycetota bacterium]
MAERRRGSGSTRTRTTSTTTASRASTGRTKPKQGERASKPKPKPKPKRGERASKPKPKPKRAVASSAVADGLLGGRTLADPHDAEGHVVLRGLAWGAAAVLALVAGPWPFAVFLGVIAAVAAWEIAMASADTELCAEPVLAAALAGVLPLAAWFDSAAAGAVLVTGVV